MKKIIALLLAFTTVFAMALLTSCDEETAEPNETNVNQEVSEKAETPDETETPDEPVTPDAPKASLFETVDAAIKNTLAATSLEAKLRVDQTSDIMGNKSSSWKDVVVKTSGNNISVVGNKNEYDFESAHEYYYDGEWMYFNAYGDNYKQQVDVAEFSAQAGGVAGAIVVLPEAVFANAVDNGTSVEITLDEATVEALYNDTIVKIVCDIVGNDLNQATTKDAKITLSVKDGYIENYNLSFACEIIVGNDRADYTFNQTINLSNVGGAVTVQFPHGYQNYSELDWG